MYYVVEVLTVEGYEGWRVKSLGLRSGFWGQGFSVSGFHAVGLGDTVTSPKGVVLNSCVPACASSKLWRRGALRFSCINDSNTGANGVTAILQYSEIKRYALSPQPRNLSRDPKTLPTLSFAGGWVGRGPETEQREGGAAASSRALAEAPLL